MLLRKVAVATAVAVGAMSTVWAGWAWAPSSVESTTVAAMSMEIDGIGTVMFTRCLGLGSASAVIEHAIQFGETIETELSPGRTTYDRIVCERGFTADTTLAQWRDEVVSAGPSFQKSSVFRLFDSTFAPIATWNAYATWPSELTNHFEGSSGREVVVFVADLVERIEST